MTTTALAVMAILKNASVNVALAPAEGSYWKKTLVGGLMGGGAGAAAISAIDSAGVQSGIKPWMGAAVGVPLGMLAGAFGDARSRAVANGVNSFEALSPAQQLLVHNAILGDKDVPLSSEEAALVDQHASNLLSAHTYRNPA